MANRIILISQIILAGVGTCFHYVSILTGGLLFCRIKITGLENLHKIQLPLVIALNHRSFFDHFFLGPLLLRYVPNFFPIHFVAARWLFHQPWYKGGELLQLGLQLIGAIQMENFYSIRRATEILRKGGAIAIYPEGMLSKTMGIAKLHNGAAYLAKRGGAQLIPMAIRGIENPTLPSLLFGRRLIYISIGTPFSAKSLDEKEALTQCLYQELTSLYDALGNSGHD